MSRDGLASRPRVKRFVFSRLKSLHRVGGKALLKSYSKGRTHGPGPHRFLSDIGAARRLERPTVFRMPRHRVKGEALVRRPGVH